MTTYYFDFVGGADGNDGLSPAAPKQTPQSIAGLVLVDNVLRLKRGVVWPRTGFFGDIVLDLQGKNPAGLCTITDYGEAIAPPTFDCLEYDNSAAGWTHAGSGRWTKAVAQTVERIMFGGSITALSIGGLSWAGVAPTSPDKFWWSAGTLHINNGSTTVSPPIYYGGLALVANNSSDGIRIQNSSNLRFERIRTNGGDIAGWEFVTSTSDTNTIELVDCEALRPFRWGFRIDSAGGGFKNRVITLTRPIYDNKTDATENEGSSARVGGSDGYKIGQNYDDIVITNPTMIRARHAGINCYDSIGGSPGDLTVTATPNYGNFDSTVIEYGRALNLIGSIAGQNTRISGIKSTGQATRSQFSGTLLLSGCSWKALRFDDVINGFEVSQVWWFQTWTAGPGNSHMVDVTLQNNLIENPYSVPVAFAKGTATAGSYDADKIKLYNNTIVDVNHYAHLGRKSFQTVSLGFGDPAFQLVRNNNLISPSPGANQVIWGGVASGINGTTGFTGNVENVEGYVDRINGDYHPTLLGGLKYAGIAGSPLALDLNGLPFNSTPSIAPFEFVPTFIRRFCRPRYYYHK